MKNKRTASLDINFTGSCTKSVENIPSQELQTLLYAQSLKARHVKGISKNCLKHFAN